MSNKGDQLCHVASRPYVDPPARARKPRISLRRAIFSTDTSEATKELGYPFPVELCIDRTHLTKDFSLSFHFPKLVRKGAKSRV